MNYVKKFLKYVGVNLMASISFFVPKEKNLWVFGAWRGCDYSDNTKYFFEYIRKYHPEINAVWITRKPEVNSALNDKGIASYMRFSLKGIIKCLRAEAAFVTEGKHDISPFLNLKCTKTVNLFHGFPIKALKWMRVKENKQLNTAKRFNKYFWISSSDANSKIMSDMLGIKYEKFCVTGYPRNDTFFYKDKNSEVFNILNKYKNKKYIIYMPTHRNFGSKKIDELINPKAFKELDRILGVNNLIMVYKPHFHELKKFLKYDDKFNNIIFAKEDVWNDTYSYLHMFDLLISDYSSVMIDFLCSKKPIVCFPYDIEDYEKNDAGINDYYWTKPFGPICYTWKETIDTVIKLLNEDEYKITRDESIHFYQTYNDGKNCERVYAYVTSIRRKK